MNALRSLRSPRSPRTLLMLALPVALAAGLAPRISAQPGPVGSREAMWPAPTAEDWARPCLITWQRTYDDALALSRETGKPVMVCINMDGEIASEHYAGVRYRQPEIAALYAPYVCVIASVYRHTPRDYDAIGRRIPCPRFGGVTCGEHIAIEPGLFSQFMDTRRIAPRHIGVELDGEELYDVYYAFDTESVFDTLRDGIEGRDVDVRELRSDRTLVERAASPDSRDQAALEAMYLEGSDASRQALLQAALAAGESADVDLLRLAVRGGNVTHGRLARRALVQSRSNKAIDVIVEALGDPLAAGEQDELIAALQRLGEDSPRAATLAVVHRGLSNPSHTLEPAAWFAALEQPGSAPPAATDGRLHADRLANQDALLESGDPTALLELAESFLAQAYELPERERSSLRWLLMDARQTALQAQRAGAEGWRVHAALAIAAHYLGDIAESRARAEQALGRGLPDDVRSWDALAVLTIFAQGRREAIAQAVADNTEWPAEWVTDVHAVCSILDEHPHTNPGLIEGHYDFLRSLGASGAAAEVLDRGLQRFPDSGLLHARLRRQVLAEQGIDALEARYASMAPRADAGSSWPWFAGQASFVAAEFHRRAGRDERAVRAYDRSIALFERDIEANPDLADETRPQIALALAGQARLAFEREDDALAHARLLASFARCSDAAATLDGLNLSPVDTAKMLLARLATNGEDELARSLEGALRALDARLLRLPAYEEELPPDGQQRRRPPWRRPR